MPVMVWILATFRREDRLGTIGLSLFGAATGGNPGTSMVHSLEE